MTGLSVAK